MKKVIIILLIIIIVLGGSIGGYFIYQDIELKKPIKEEWGQKYYVHLKEKRDLPKNSKVSLIETKEQKKPVLILKHEEKKEEYINIYYIEEDKVNEIIYDEQVNINLLYNIENKEYNYYIHTTKDEYDYYQSIDGQIEKNDTSAKDIPDYAFKKEEGKTIEIEEGKSLNISAFDKEFIKIDEDLDYISLDNLKEKEIKKALEDSIEKYEPLKEIIDEKIEKEVQEKVEDINKYIEKEKALSIDTLYTKLKGIWYNSENSLGFTIENSGDKRILNWGYFGSESIIKDIIKSVEAKDDNIFEFTLSSETVTIDISEIDKKVIKVEKYKHTYVGANWDQAYDKVLN